MKAGYTSFSFETEYGYNLEGALWYPSISAEVEVCYLPSLRGHAAKDGEFASGKFPLIIFSSGYGGTLYDQAYLAEALARQGMLVVAVSHQPFERKSAVLGVERAWYRIRELSMAIDFILQSSFHSVISNPEKIGALGFSAGGFAVLTLAGARPQFHQSASFEKVCAEYASLDFSALQDPRLGAIALLAPALGGVFNAKDLTKVVQPTLLLLAERDEVLAETTHLFSEALPNIITHFTLAEAGHFVFNGPATPLMKKLFPATCHDSGLPRESFHPVIVDAVQTFFGSYFRRGHYE